MRCDRFCSFAARFNALLCAAKQQERDAVAIRCYSSRRFAAQFGAFRLAAIIFGPVRLSALRVRCVRRGALQSAKVR